jgi:hypothetical protein
MSLSGSIRVFFLGMEVGMDRAPSPEAKYATRAAAGFLSISKTLFS